MPITLYAAATSTSTHCNQSELSRLEPLTKMVVKLTQQLDRQVVADGEHQVRVPSTLQTRALGFGTAEADVRCPDYATNRTTRHTRRL